MAEIVVIDTCILISNPLRILLLDLGLRGLLKPAWSSVIGDEWRRNAGRLWGVCAEDMSAHWAMMQDQFPKADQGDVSVWKQGLQRSDPKDWHVVAAARAAIHDAEVRRDALEPPASMQSAVAGGLLSEQPNVTIVTRNLKDFNRRELRQLGIGLTDPDTLLVRFWQQNRDLMNALLLTLPERVRSPDKPVLALMDLLKRERLFRLNRLMGQM
jgi:hypothetical protein